MHDATMPTWGVFLIIAGFFVVFPLFWCGIVLLISRVGAWHTLSRSYAAGSREVVGQRHDSIFGLVGIARYKWTLTVHVADEGFFLDVMPLFRIGHPRLFIPWTAISHRETKSGIFSKDLSVISIGSPPIAKVSLAMELPEQRT